MRLGLFALDTESPSSIPLELRGDSLHCYTSRGQEGEWRVKFTGGAEDIAEKQGAECKA